MIFRDKFDGWLVINGDMLKEQREKMKFPFSQKKRMAKYLGIDRKVIKDYEDGKSFPSLATFKKLCLYLQISADVLLGLEEIKK